MRNSIPYVAVVLMTVLGRTSAQAAWRIDAEGGAFVPVSNVSVQTGGEDIDVNTHAGGSVAAGGGYGVTDWAEVTSHFQGNFAGLGLFNDAIQVYSLTAGGRFYLMSPHLVRPWVSSEIGWYHANADLNSLFSSTSKSDDSFGLNAGGGFDVAVSERISLGVDVRYHDAFKALNGMQFVTTMLDLGVHLGQ